MGDLTGRSFSINLGGTLIESKPVAGQIKPTLRVVFQIEKNLARDANTAEVAIYNLKESTRGLLARKGIETILEAGYAGNSHTLFRGRLDHGATGKDGPNWLSELESTDGGKETRDARINVSFKSIGVDGAIRAAADAMGLGLGNVEEKLKSGNLIGSISKFANGLVMSGQAAPQLDKLIRSFGFEWSIQDGQIIMLEPAGVLDPERAIVLSAETGLVGSPQAGDDGTVEARSLMIPQLQPGRKVEIKSELVGGFFKVTRSVFLGDTWGQDWYTEIEAQPL